MCFRNITQHNIHQYTYTLVYNNQPGKSHTPSPPLCSPWRTTARSRCGKGWPSSPREYHRSYIAKKRLIVIQVDLRASNQVVQVVVILTILHAPPSVDQW